MTFFSGVYGTCIGAINKFGTEEKSLIGLSGIFIGIGEILGRFKKKSFCIKSVCYSCVETWSVVHLGDSISSPSPLPWDWGLGWKFQPSNQGWVRLATGRHPDYVGLPPDPLRNRLRSISCAVGRDALWVRALPFTEEIPGALGALPEGEGRGQGRDKPCFYYNTLVTPYSGVVCSVLAV